MLQIGIAVVIVGFALRLVNLLALPLFIDEIFHLNRAHAIALGNPFAGLEHDKWLYTVMLGVLFRPLGPEGPFIARYLTVLFSATTIASCLALGRLLHSRLAGVLAASIYAVIPMAIFIERQALVDGTLAAFSTLSLLVSIYLVRRPTVQRGVALALLLTAAYLTKGTGFPFLLIPVFAVILFATTRQQTLQGGGLIAAAIAIAYLTKTIIWEIASRQADFAGVLETHDVTGAAFSGLANLTDVGYLTTRLAPYIDILQTYVGWLLIFLVLSALVWVVRRQSVRAILFMLIPSIALGVATSLADSPSLSNRVEVRYLMPTVAPLVILAAMAAALSIGQFARRMQHYVAIGLVFALVIPYASLNSALINDPLSAPLRAEDAQAYRDAALESKRTVSETIMERERLGTALQVVGPFDCCQPYMGPRWADYTTLTLDDRQLPQQLRSWYEDDQTIYLVENTAFFVLPEHRLGAQLELVTSANMPLGQMNLYQVRGIGVDGAAATDFYDFVAPDPGQLPDDEALLAERLNNAEGQVLVHPSAFTATFGATSIDIDSWPMNRSAAEQALSSVLPREAFVSIDVVQVNSHLTDADQQLALALDSSLYLLRQETIGLFEWTAYTTGPADLTPQSVGVVFEDAITLEQVVWAVNDRVLAINLIWQTDTEIDDLFKVFVHIVDADDEIVAQRDSEPGNGLFPTTDWNTDFPVSDRFAIQLPSDLAPGEYEVRVGLYEPNSGLRLRVTNGEFSDYARITVLTIP